MRRSLNWRTLGEQFARFLVVGAVVALVQFAVLYALVRYAKVGSVSASSCGFVVSAALNYFLNYTFTFRSNARHRQASVRFLAVAAFGFVLNAAFMKLGTDVLSIHYMYSQIGAIGCVIVWNFSANRRWTFGATARGDEVHSKE